MTGGSADGRLLGFDSLERTRVSVLFVREISEPSYQPDRHPSNHSTENNMTPIFDRIRDEYGYQCGECIAAHFPYLTFACEECN